MTRAKQDEIETWTCAECPLLPNGDHVGDQGHDAHAYGLKHERETGHVVWYDVAETELDALVLRRLSGRE